ncbi:hypothetical protein C7451_106105 [Blastomonas natatoria]|uniref:Uncharacterized protein n=1 Tax=Blastomonas natatoria TaxID=34015 RepID=A0A2V3V4S2_9SPHN|nr:hypothetical protein [Blastomonas natatoria]PXW75941.1 hypothetical protein C7451_106105 [Blastomonas natatoria]
MFGFVTKAKHEAALAKWHESSERTNALMKEAADKIAELRAEIDHLRPLANKWTADIAQASKNLKQNKGKGK